jgi:hypothetical protein
MQARASGLGVANIGISSINDPFLLSTDPVHLYDPMTLTLTPAAAASDAPEPGSWLLCLAGAAILLGSRKIKSKGKAGYRLPGALATARRFNRPSLRKDFWPESNHRQPLSHEARSSTARAWSSSSSVAGASRRNAR